VGGRGGGGAWVEERGREGEGVRLRGEAKQKHDGPEWGVVDVACVGTLMAVSTGCDSRCAVRARPRGDGDAGVARCSGLVVASGPDRLE